MTKSKQSDKILLLGAGFSIPFDIPGMPKMITKFNQQPLSESAKKGLGILNELKVSKDLEEILLAIERIIEFPNSHIDKFINKSIETQGALTKYKKTRSYALRHINALRKELLQFISTACLRFDRPKAEQYLKVIIEACNDQQVPIYTTNYDGIIEHVATIADKQIVDNFKPDSLNRQFWDKTLESFNKSGIQLTKIHGSIYWLINSKGEIEKLDPPAPHNREGEKLTQMLIFPTRFKDIYQANYFPLYSRFVRRLNDSNLLIVIGHSLRDEYLLAAIREKLTDNNFKLLIVDPSEKPLKKLGVTRNVYHAKLGILECLPLINQLIHDSYKGDEADLLTHFIDKASPQRKNKLKITGERLRVQPNTKISFTLEIDTWRAQGNVEFSIVNNKMEKVADLINSTDVPLEGLVDDSIYLTMKVPKDIKHGKYKLLASSVDNEGDKFYATKPIEIIE